MHLLALWPALLLSALSLTEAETCCASCLDQSDPLTTVITYDPLVFEQCSAAKGICCYGCSFAYGSLSYQDGVTIDDNGTALASAGQPFTFNNVARVTFEILGLHQAQTNFVSNGTTTASTSDDGKVFVICADGPGTVVFRGWGAMNARKQRPSSRSRSWKAMPLALAMPMDRSFRQLLHQQRRTGRWIQPPMIQLARHQLLQA